MKPLNRPALLAALMKEHGFSKKAVADKFELQVDVVERWLDVSLKEAQIPKDKLCQLIDVELLLEVKGLTEADAANICGVSIPYVNGWVAGTIPMTVNAGIKLLLYGEKK